LNPHFQLVKIVNITTTIINLFIHRVEGAIRCGLDSPVEESEENDETAPDGYHATLTSEQGWIDANAAELPQLTLKHIHQY